MRRLGLCFLLAAAVAGRVAAPARALDPLPSQPDGVPWPTVEWPQHLPDSDVDQRRLADAIESAFLPTGRGGLPDTRALLVVHRGAIVAERYASGFGPDSRFQSWSVAKSVTQALVGILVRERRLDIRAPAEVPAWQADDDPRRRITLKQLLHMTSGLANADDDEDPVRSFSTQMTYGSGAADIAAFAAAAPLAHEPGTHWEYSTATTTILAHIVGRAAGGGRDATLAFMRRALFEPLGMRSAVPEFDAAGTFAGGMFLHASARDYARFGLLFLRDGVWDGVRILPEGWVDFTRTPAPVPNNRVYGAHVWLNVEPVYGPTQYSLLDGAPESTFGASGLYGQQIVIVPTRDLVVVRLGHMEAITWRTLKESLAAVVGAFPDRQAPGGPG